MANTICGRASQLLNIVNITRRWYCDLCFFTKSPQNCDLKFQV